MGTREMRLDAVVGGNVRWWRQRRGLTQEEAASRSGIDYKRWQKIEAGRVNLTLRTIGRVAGVLRVAPHKLLQA